MQQVIVTRKLTSENLIFYPFPFGVAFSNNLLFLFESKEICRTIFIFSHNFKVELFFSLLILHLFPLYLVKEEHELYVQLSPPFTLHLRPIDFYYRTL